MKTVSHDLTEAVKEVLAPILREMSARLDNDLSEGDLLALQTAVTKVAVEASNRGIVETIAWLLEQLPGVALQGSLQLPPAPDAWAERHGDSESEESQEC